GLLHRSAALWNVGLSSGPELTRCALSASKLLHHLSNQFVLVVLDEFFIECTQEFFRGRMLACEYSEVDLILAIEEVAKEGEHVIQRLIRVSGIYKQERVLRLTDQFLNQVDDVGLRKCIHVRADNIIGQ